MMKELGLCNHLFLLLLNPFNLEMRMSIPLKMPVREQILQKKLEKRLYQIRLNNQDKLYISQRMFHQRPIPMMLFYQATRILRFPFLILILRYILREMEPWTTLYLRNHPTPINSFSNQDSRIPSAPLTTRLHTWKLTGYQ